MRVKNLHFRTLLNIFQKKIAQHLFQNPNLKNYFSFDAKFHSDTLLKSISILTEHFSAYFFFKSPKKYFPESIFFTIVLFLILKTLIFIPLKESGFYYLLFLILVQSNIGASFLESRMFAKFLLD